MPRLLIEILHGIGIEGRIPNALPGTSVSAQLTARNAVLPLVWEKVSGDWPPTGDWEIDAAAGLVTGDADDTGLYEVTIMVTDGVGNFAQKTFQWRVAAAPLLLTGSAPDGNVGDAYTYTYSIDGGVPPYFPAIVVMPGFGPPPDGLSLSLNVDDDLDLSGLPEVDASFTFQIWLNDSQVPSAAFASLIDTIVITNSATYHILTEASLEIETEAGDLWRLE